MTMKPSEQLARECCAAYKNDRPFEEVLAALLDARWNEAAAETKREVHERIRKTMMHPTVKDVPIPAALWHLMRNLEHETGDNPIGLGTPASGAEGA